MLGPIKAANINLPLIFFFVRRFDAQSLKPVYCFQEAWTNQKFKEKTERFLQRRTN